MLRQRSKVIHKNFKISRIRNFYMRKVKFTQDSFDEKLGAILTEFPILDVRYPVYLAYPLNLTIAVAGRASFPFVAHECTLR